MSGKKQFFNFNKFIFTKKKIAYIPQTVKVSMNQYGFEECVPVVKTGEYVNEGQIIGRGYKENASVHSPVPGLVVGFEYLSIPNGKRSLTAIINMEGNFTYTGKGESISDWNIFSSTELITMFKNKGIVNSFLHKPVSLSALCEDDSNKGKVLYVCLFDSQPDIYVDSFLTKYYLQKIVIGAQIVAKSIQSPKIVFFYYDDHSKAQSSRIKTFLQHSVDAEFVAIRDYRYPNGVTNELIRIAHKNKLNKTEDSEILNPAFAIESSTLNDVYNGIVLSKPVIERIVQVTGTGLYKSRLFQVRIGTPIEKLLFECGGSRKVPGKIVINGLIQGIAISDIKTPITKFVKSISVLENKQLQSSTISVCTHCGRCHAVCPEGIHPDALFAAYIKNTVLPTEILATKNWCTECGLCNTVCPSRLPLTQAISFMKDEKNDC